jgi:gluconate 2-dehydrogenase alpha chain
MKELRPVDVVIVGGGWTGLLLAKEIASRTGLQVQVLERGRSRGMAEYQTDMDELDWPIHHRMMVNAAEETVTLRHDISQRALPVRRLGSFHPGSGVGGAGEHWGAVSYRYLPDFFRLRSRIVERYGEKRLPEESAVRDWPISFEELEPYYTRTERLMGISGKASNIQGRQVEGGNFFEGRRSEEFPTPPMKQPYLTKLFYDGAKSLGYHPYPTPSAALSQTYTNPDGVTRGACAFCGYCARFGCMVGAKAQPTNTLLPVLNRLKNFKLQTSSWVRRIQVKDGRAVGVEYTNDKGEEFFQPASLVILSTFTLNNNRLLLLSKIGELYDPRTGTGTLGANFTHQVSIGAATMFFDQPLNRFMGAGGAGATIHDFDADVFDHSDLPFLRGGILQVNPTGALPISSFGVVPDRVRARWGSEWKKEAIHYFDRVGGIGFAGEHMAYKGNYVDLDPVYKDKFGDPLLRLTLNWRDNERKMVEFIVPKAVEIGRAMGAKEVRGFAGLRNYDTVRYQSTHVQGGTSMGASPADSVLNKYGQHWQVPNLFVTGASVYPQNAAPNPTITVVALAYHTADAVIDKYLKQPGKLA